MKAIKYRDFPIAKVVDQANERINQLARDGIKMRVHQKWTCRHCGSRQTMGEKNQFFGSGICEECGETTIIQKCNYVAMIGDAPDVS